MKSYVLLSVLAAGAAAMGTGSKVAIAVKEGAPPAAGAAVTQTV
jgi:hypothetical protein